MINLISYKLKMRKEFFVSLLIVILIFIANFFSKRYTENFKNNIINNFDSLKTSVNEARKKENENAEIDENLLNNINNNFNNMKDVWIKNQDILSYYVEHNELEKIDLNIVSLGSYLQTEQYDESIGEIDEGVFSVKHIGEKYLFNLKNVL